MVDDGVDIEGRASIVDRLAHTRSSFFNNFGYLYLLLFFLAFFRFGFGHADPILCNNKKRKTQNSIYESSELLNIQMKLFAKCKWPIEVDLTRGLVMSLCHHFIQVITYIIHTHWYWLRNVSVVLSTKLSQAVNWNISKLAKKSIIVLSEFIELWILSYAY